MIKHNEFVELITALVLQQTGAAYSVLILDKCEADECKPDNYKYICVNYLSVESIANIAVGTYKNKLEKTIIDCIMLNKRIFVISTQLEEIKSVCNPNFYNTLLRHRDTLSGYNIEFLSQLTESDNPAIGAYATKSIGTIRSVKSNNTTMLIAESDILSLPPDSTITALQGTIITPAARDAANRCGIIINTL